MLWCLASDTFATCSNRVRYYYGVRTHLSLNTDAPVSRAVQAVGSIVAKPWFRAKSIEAIFGPMAEARLTGEPFDEVWNGYSSEGDVRDVIRTGRFCGMAPLCRGVFMPTATSPTA
jgi:hypothetical protein